MATPDGRVSRYYFGIDYPVKDVLAELKRAASGKIGSPISGLLLLCYDYDSATGKYTLSIVRLLRVLGISTVLALGSFVFILSRRDRLRRQGEKINDGGGPDPASLVDAGGSS